MKVTSFYPLIATKHQDEVKNALAALGFEVAHVKTDFAVVPSANTIMKDADGHRVELSDIGDMVNAVNDTVMIRVNVDNLEEARQVLSAKGFQINSMDDTGSAKYCMLTSPNGLTIDLCEHIK